MGHFATPQEAPLPVGRQPKEVPPALVAVLERTFTQGLVYEDQIDAGDVREFLLLCQLHARRRGLSFRYRLYDDADGNSWIRLRMCRKRTYNHAHTRPREATP